MIRKGKGMKAEKYSRLFSALWKAILLFLVCFFLTLSAKEAHAATAGFVKENGNTYYMLEDGTFKKGWLTLKGKKYYFNKKTGIMQKGWTGKGKKRRYFSLSNGRMLTGWVKVSGGNIRYFDPKTGYMRTGWMTMDNLKYYFDLSTGYARRGWSVTKKHSRYYNSKTGAMFTGLHKIKGYYYYFGKNGYLYKGGWKTIGTKKYYFDLSTGRAKVGWLNLADKSYYFDKKGVMYSDTQIKISGQYYVFEKDGAAKNVPYVISGNNVKVYVGGKSYLLVKEFLTHPGIADGTVSDEELLAALIDCEASMQGKIGMEACALAILNRTLSPTREFPANLRYVIYQGVNYPQYSPVRNGALLRRLKGNYEDKETAQKAAKAALSIFNKYVTNGTPRKLKGFKTKDFNYMYFMTPGSFWNQNLDFSRVNYCIYSANGESHVFFEDWIS